MDAAYVGEFHVYLHSDGTLVLCATDGSHTRMGRVVVPDDDS